MIKIGIMKKGDEILNVTPEFIAVKRKNQEVDIIKIVQDEIGEYRIDTDHIVTLGYGANTVTVENERGDSVITF